MDDAFAVILVVVVAAGAVAGLWAAARDRDAYHDVGGGPLAMDRDPATQRHRPSAPAPVAAAEREAEIRQLLEARNARRAARGEPAIDVEAELARLLAPSPSAVDPGLVTEIRDLVVARNERRLRAGKAPLDVDVEVARRLREMT